jgi:hypothetical protein
MLLQELLGYALLSTTALYTQPGHKRRLREIVKRYRREVLLAVIIGLWETERCYNLEFLYKDLFWRIGATHSAGGRMYCPMTGVCRLLIFWCGLRWSGRGVARKAS